MNQESLRKWNGNTIKDQRLKKIAYQGYGKMNRTILIADDVEANRIILQQILQVSGYEVKTYESASLCSGDILFNNDSPEHLGIFMDIHNPSLDDGIHATQLLRCMGYDKPIIAYTSNGQHPPSYYSDLEFTDILVKPTCPHKVKQLIQRCF